MRKQIFSALGMLMAVIAFSQPVTITENFDGNTNTYTSYPASAWKTEINYYVSTQNSIRGVVPNMMGDEITLTSPVYDLSKYSHVLFRFSHICKVSPQDIARVEYKISGMGWQAIPFVAYKGNANINLYSLYGFNTNLYADWKGNDSLAIPLQSWWKEEIFDVSTEVGMDYEVQFRFIIKHGTVPGTQISYGWLLDNIEVMASENELYPPVVEFVSPLVKDTVYSTGIHRIEAKVKSRTTAQTQTPYLIYTAFNNQQILTDTVLMTNIAGDSLWEAEIPQFVAGSEVVYSITGGDVLGNMTTIISGYVIIKPLHQYGNISVALNAIASPMRGQTVSGITTPIEVFLRNKGDSALTSATIHWRVNGVESSLPWTGNLIWDFEELVSLGTYLPRLEGYDTIEIWVSTPNGITDPVLEDDTLSIITYGCTANMSGVYTVGQGGIFPTIEDALKILNLCHPTGDITLALQSGVYTENWRLSDLYSFIGNHTLTITSLANDKDSVILRPASGVGVLLSNTNNLVLEAITVDARQGTYGIQLTNACTNIKINNCIILANPNATTNAYGAIYKASGSGSLHNMSITNCTITGGYYGIYLYGASNSYCQNITVDSNIINDQYYYATCFYYTGFNSVSYNYVTPRKTGQGTTWYGFMFYDARNGGNIIGNRVICNNSGITSTIYGMYMYSMNNALVANNEIYIHSSAGSTCGMYLYLSNNVDYIHNSVVLTGTGGVTFQAAQIYVSTSALYNATYKNNIFVAHGGATPYAVYLSAAPNATTFAQYNHIDHNNYYSSGNLGYAGSILANLDAWKSVVITDSNSINVLPEFVDIQQDLKVSNYADILCQLTSAVNTDINNNSRTGITTMGCYENIPSVNFNGTPVRLLGLRDGSINNQTDNIRLVFLNGGDHPITSFNVEWSVDGVSKAAGGNTYTTSLNKGEFDTVYIGNITYSPGIMNIAVWINSLNGGLTDEFHGDDTLRIANFICNTTFSGTITIGTTGTFPTITDALDRVLLCGISGDITFVLDSGEYNENVNMTNISNVLGNHTLSIISANGKAEDVVLHPASGVAILMGNTHNIRIENITINALQGTYAIQLIDACSNIVIDHCIIQANPTATTTAYLFGNELAGRTNDNCYRKHNRRFIGNGKSYLHYSLYCSQ
jgi:hypothetical protein